MGRSLRIKSATGRTCGSPTRYRALVFRKRVSGEMLLERQPETGRVTGRQLEVLCLLAIGLTSSETAKRLGISEHTVIRHITNMGISVGAGNRLELLALAIIGGLIDPNTWPPRPTGELRLQIV
jgi:DNA-binding CsgD family transcriptional regulator